MNRIALFLIAALSILLTMGCKVEKNKNYTPLEGIYQSHPYFGSPAETKHADWLRANHFNIRQCQACHGTYFDGGTSGVGCNECHNSNSTGIVTNCNFCHGSGGEAAKGTMANWAPPRSLSGETDMTVRGVGRHQFHLTELTDFNCSTCHDAPTLWDSPTHMNGRIDMYYDIGFDSTTVTCNRCHSRESYYFWNKPTEQRR